MNIKDRNFEPEMYFSASRSGGKGGQNVNKVSTKMSLNFDIHNSNLLTEEEKQVLKLRLKNKIDKNGFIRIVSQTERSQLLNKKKAIARFIELLANALKVKKSRVETKPSNSSKEKRLVSKKNISQKKSLRKINFNNEL
jgi:ribosome-associated protein